MSNTLHAKNISVLVVDDVETIRSFLRIVLLGMEFSHVDTASSAAEAIKKSEMSPFDLIFLDINLPDLDGLELLKTLQQKHPSAAFVMCSGSSTKNNVRAALKEGAVGFLAKPVTPSNLNAVLNRLGFSI